MITGSAPGKVILFGEHAVVYGRPAIAVPVVEVQAQVTLVDGGAGLLIRAAEQSQTYRYTSLGPTHPLGAIIRLALAELHASSPPDATLTITSTIPIAGGLGSGAAVSAAVVRALAAYYGRTLGSETVSDLVYEVEKIHHGTPSGIDNTVVAYAQPVYFVRNQTLHLMQLPRPFTLVVGDTGVASPTKNAVADVRQAWETDSARFERLFDACGHIVDRARALIEAGLPDRLGPLMTENQGLLSEMTVSSAELDALVAAALEAGALGAKLSGGGRGGNMIALVTPSTEPAVKAALVKAGARRVIGTVVGPTTASRPPAMIGP